MFATETAGFEMTDDSLLMFSSAIEIPLEERASRASRTTKASASHSGEDFVTSPSTIGQDVLSC